MSSAKVAEVFNLMDARGFGRINLEAFFEFTDTLPGPPNHDDIMNLYQEFDDDGSGDIDSDEFSGLCEALENLVGLDTEQMISAYTRHQYEMLFELVDEDGGGTIDKAELKAVVEPLQGILGLKTTAADVAIIFRNMGTEELSSEDFYIVMEKITAGRPIGQVVRAFKHAKKQSSVQKEFATLAFDEEKRLAYERRKAAEEAQNAPAPQPQVVPRSRVCLNCARKELEIQELKEKLDKLERESHASDIAEREATFEPVVRESIESISKAVPIFESFPRSLHAAMHIAKTNRMKRIAIRSCEVPMDALAKELANTADSTHKSQLQLQGVMGPMLESVNKILAVKQELMDMVTAQPPVDFVAASTTLSEMLATVQTNKSIVQNFAEDGAWVLDQVIESRSDVCDMAMAGAPYSTAPKKLMECVQSAENVTIETTELVTLCLYYGCDNPCEVEDMLDRALSNNVPHMSPETLEAMQNVIDVDRNFFKKERWDACAANMKDTLYKLQAKATSFMPRTKDRGVATMPIDFLEPLAQISTPKRHDPTAQMKVGGMSRPPRTREKRRDVQYSQVHVDALVKKCIRGGAPVPTNFRRATLLEHQDALRHVFHFGTKRIDIVVVDEMVMVHVGGGFLTFPEFCGKYCDYEQSRIDREAERNAMLQMTRESSASPTTSMAQQVFEGSLRSPSYRSSSYRSSSMRSVSPWPL